MAQVAFTGVLLAPMAGIALHQIVDPLTFQVALDRIGDSGREP